MQRKHMFLIAVLLLAAKGFSFDDDRQGFMLGLGLGFHSTTMAVEFDGDEEWDDSYNGLATSFKIGGGVSPNLMLYYVSNASWFSEEGIQDDITVTAGLAAFGMTYFIEPSAPSLFINGALGIASYDAPFESDLDPEYGVGLSVGVGYEFSDHLTAEANFMYNTIEPDGTTDVEIITKSFQIYFTYLFY